MMSKLTDKNGDNEYILHLRILRQTTASVRQLQLPLQLLLQVLRVIASETACP